MPQLNLFTLGQFRSPHPLLIYPYTACRRRLRLHQPPRSCESHFHMMYTYAYMRLHTPTHSNSSVTSWNAVEIICQLDDTMIFCNSVKCENARTR
jgi:hypothetical protein